MTTIQHINQTVATFLALLAQADSVVANSPMLSEWNASEPIGNPNNEVVFFTWEDADGTYSLTLTEGGIQAGQWKGQSFFCEDHEGDEVQISLYRHVAMTPPACKQCDSPLHGEYCSNDTCCYHDWPQAIPREDLKVFSTEEVEEKYQVNKRVTDPA